MAIFIVGQVIIEHVSHAAASSGFALGKDLLDDVLNGRILHVQVIHRQVCQQAGGHLGGISFGHA